MIGKNGQWNKRTRGNHFKLIELKGKGTEKEMKEQKVLHNKVRKWCVSVCLCMHVYQYIRSRQC